MKRLSAHSAALLTALLLGAGTAHADFYSNWSYTLGLNTSPTFASSSGFSTVSFALNPNGSTGVSDIPVGNFTSNSSSGTADPVSGNYILTVGVTDTASGLSHNFQWQGVIGGSVSAATTDPTTGNTVPGVSSLSNAFTGQDSNGNFGNSGTNLTEQFTLGSHVYTVTIDPGSADGTNPINGPTGAPVLVDASVTVSNVTTNVSASPEPSALVLAGCAVSLAGLRRWRRGRLSGAGL